jgi:hypothetical protein
VVAWHPYMSSSMMFMATNGEVSLACLMTGSVAPEKMDLMRMVHSCCMIDLHGVTEMQRFQVNQMLAENNKLKEEKVLLEVREPID